MDPATFAAAVAALMLTEALKEGGKEIWRGTSSTIQKLVSTIRDKFTKSKVEGPFISFEQNPSEETKAFFQICLAEYLKADKNFAKQVEELMQELKPEKSSSPGNSMSMNITDVDVKAGNSSTVQIGIQSAK